MLVFANLHQRDWCLRCA